MGDVRDFYHAMSHDESLHYGCQPFQFDEVAGTLVETVLGSFIFTWSESVIMNSFPAFPSGVG